MESLNGGVSSLLSKIQPKNAFWGVAASNTRQRKNSQQLITNSKGKRLTYVKIFIDCREIDDNFFYEEFKKEADNLHNIVPGESLLITIP